MTIPASVSTERDLIRGLQNVTACLRARRRGSRAPPGPKFLSGTFILIARRCGGKRDEGEPTRRGRVDDFSGGSGV